MTDKSILVTQLQQSHSTGIESVNPDFERLQSTQASRLQEIQFIEDEKKRIQSKLEAIALGQQEQNNTIIHDNTSYKKQKNRRKKNRVKGEEPKRFITRSP
ncbi:hypothetical protein LOD99_10312 [Oopsacas minuta]|uniref:Uncharacterized protein n=1 Tax=Oopsacas minuta TaxID=111878 RepID=A0AAV7KL90_9METZ|nr:hypothetical protein LOD99_10312 [Oopsacas minuta]